LLLPPPPRSTLFPYTTLFRSRNHPPRPDAPRLPHLARGCCGAPPRTPARSAGVNPAPLAAVAPCRRSLRPLRFPPRPLRLEATPDRKSTRLNSSHDQISYAVF